MRKTITALIGSVDQVASVVHLASERLKAEAESDGHLFSALDLALERPQEIRGELEQFEIVVGSRAAEVHS